MNNFPGPLALIATLICTVAFGQQPPYDVVPEAAPPYYRVRYDASDEEGKLAFPVQYTVWIPSGVDRLRGVVVHQHGCGEGSCKSGLTGAYDLHWQALARKHSCALLSPSYEQPEGANCQLWCDPRNGSAAAFDRGLKELGEQAGHPELATAPLAIWGHSGGGHWCGGMVLTQPERIAAAWLRSGVPAFESAPDRSTIKPFDLTEAALRVPIMCNPGTKEGVTDKEGRFAKVWPANIAFFEKIRGQGGVIGIAIDPLTAHECGNSRYLAIPWLDKCLQLRLPTDPGGPLRTISTADSWLAAPEGTAAVPARDFNGDPLSLGWLPDAEFAQAWMQFCRDTNVVDSTPPPPPSNVSLTGNQLTWDAVADVESGIEKFIVMRDGKHLTDLSGGINRYGRPIFQGLQYSDTPLQPLVPMAFTDESTDSSHDHQYSIVTVNTAGLKSTPTAAE